MLYENVIDIPNWLLTTPDDCKVNVFLDLIVTHLKKRELKYDISTLALALHINIISSSITFKVEVESLPRLTEKEHEERSTEDRVVTITPITTKDNWPSYKVKRKQYY